MTDTKKPGLVYSPEDPDIQRRAAECRLAQGLPALIDPSEAGWLGAVLGRPARDKTRENQ